MHPIRQLARLTTRGAWFELSGGSGGGDAVMIPASEIAAALGMGGLPHAAYLLGLAVWADDSAAARKLVMSLQPAVEYRLAEKGFGAERINGLCMLPVLEVLWPRRCQDCHGEGRYWAPSCWVRNVWFKAARSDGGSWSHCDRCSGKGRVSFTVRDSAKVLGVSGKQYHTRWAVRADIARAELATLEDRLLSHVRAQMVEEESAPASSGARVANYT